MCDAVADRCDAKALVKAAGLAFAGLLVLAVLQMRPVSSAQNVALVFSPQKSLTEIFGALSNLPVEFVRTGFTDFIVVVRPAHGTNMQVLKDAGAFLVTSALSDGGCFYLNRKSGALGVKNERIS